MDYCPVRGGVKDSHLRNTTETEGSVGSMGRLARKGFSSIAKEDLQKIDTLLSTN